MKDIFSKDNLPLIERVANRVCTPRENWELMSKMYNGDGVTGQPSLQLLLLQRGMERGDAWSACQLARSYYSLAEQYPESPVFLPLALSCWSRALRARDGGAQSDLQSYGIMKSILSYGRAENSYADREMRCALLAEYMLRGLGYMDWRLLPFEEQLYRVEELVKLASNECLSVKPPEVYAVSGLSLDGKTVDGLAYYGEWKIEIRKEVFEDYNRLLQVIFHELGHIVVFSMWDGADLKAQELRKIYGITEQRANAWYYPPTDKAVPPGEEDPDTLSYGVYTATVLLFE